MLPKLKNSLPNMFGHMRQVAKGRIIFFQGEAPRHGYGILKGVVRVYALDNDGNEQIVGLYSEDDIFPLEWLMRKNRSTSFYYEALADCELFAINRSEFDSSLNTAELRQYVVDQFAKESTLGMIRNLALQQPRARDKIIYFFYFLAQRHGREVSSDLYSLGIPLTHQMLASCLGLTRETVSSELTKLKKDGAVAYRKKKYLVDKKLVINAVGKEITDLVSN